MKGLKMETWNVEFSYNIQVEAETMREAEEKAIRVWMETELHHDYAKMSIEVNNPIS